MKIGKVTGNVLKRSVLKPITYKREEMVSGAGLGADCAIFQIAKDAYGASCMQEAAVATKADIGLLIGRCVNSLAAVGATPVTAMLGLVFPENAEEARIKECMTWANEVCENHQIQIGGGHTTVSSQVTAVFATVTLQGSMAKVPGGKLRPGLDMVLTKWIGLEGTGLLAQTHREKLLARYPYGLVEEACSFLEYHDVSKEAGIGWQHDGICAMHDLSEGGVLAALWEVSEHAQDGQPLGFTVDLRKIPIRQETVEICEYIGVNPYLLRSGGSMLMMAEDGEALVRKLEAADIPAVVIGKTTAGRDRLICNEEETRFLDRPAQDEIFRVMTGK